MEKREHDLFLDMASNRQASFNDLVVAGLNSENTALQNKDDYKKDEWVKEQFKDKYGQFDDAAFDAFYNNAKVYYNNLAEVDYNKAVLENATYHRDNIFAPEDQKRKGPDFYEFKTPNPYEISSSITELGKSGPRTKSIDELAQQHKVLLNPTTAGENLENAEWGESPNDAFFPYLLTTLVLAQYDSDGEHKDLMTGEMVKHSAGDLRTNENGEFYYEKLDGRDIYGRRVLNKMNVLTTDGSWANQLDFFDSDDLQQKSIGSSVLKNLALVGTMFIPGVGPWVTGLSIATQLVGMMGTLGKMVVGSDSPTLSAMEGWSKSLNKQGAVSEYAQQNVWCWENGINLIGDVAAQITEQRFIFNQLPALFKGSKTPMTEAETNKKLAELTKKHTDLVNLKIDKLKSVSNSELLGTTRALMARASSNAQAELNSFIKGYNKLGEIMSKGYMTAITVQDTYGEAKKAGASDRDAALLTLGYAAGEYMLLNTGIGKWMLPELRAGRQRYEQIAKAVTRLNNDVEQNAWNSAKNKITGLSTKESKKNYVKEIFNIGKNLAKDVYTAEKATGSKTLKATFAAALGEGTEEVSEELLADFSKTCYDIVKWLGGNDTRINAFGYDFKNNEWDSKEVFDRYGMSLIGGFVGGGLANLATNYRQFKQFDKISNEQAIQEIISMIKNNEIDDFMKTVRKSKDLGNPNLSVDFEINGDDVMFSPGTKENNQNLMVQTVIQNQVNILKEILDANGAVSDNEFLDIQTLHDLRFGTLYNTTTAGLYIQTYNNLLSDIYKYQVAINEEKLNKLDSNNDDKISDKEKRNNDLSETSKQKISNLKKALSEKKKELNDLLEGKKSLEFISTALLESSPVMVNLLKVGTFFPLYAELVSGKKYDELTDKEKNKYLADYQVDKVQDGRERLTKAANIYKNLATYFSPTLINSVNQYLEQHDDLKQFNNYINQLYSVFYKFNEQTGTNEKRYISSETDSETIVQNAQELLGSNKDELLTQDLLQTLNTLVQNFGLESSKNEFERLQQRILEINKIENPQLKEIEYQQLRPEITGYVQDILLNEIPYYVNGFYDRGFANKETKYLLTSLLNQSKSLALRLFNDWEKNVLPTLSFSEQISTENPYRIYIQRLNSQIQDVQELNNTPIEESYNQIAIAMGKEPINISQLQEKVNKFIDSSREDVSEFTLSSTLEQELDNAITVLELYKAIIAGSRTDNANLDNLFGYNATLNEVAKKLNQESNLAEIDKDIADLYIQDIDTNLSKLKFIKKLYQANQGQKLGRNDKIAIHKDLLVYKNMRKIVSVLDNDDDDFKNWNGFLEFKSIIESLNLHNNLLNNKRPLSQQEREEFEKETIKLEDSVYEFFNKNKNKLNDINELIKFINPNRFNLYSGSEKLLNESLDNLDDNSFIWWLASRVAVKSSDFYNQYKQIISDKLAPIATQELATYICYAHIVNKSIFENFYKALKQSVLTQYQNASIEQRKEILKKLGKSAEDIELFSADNMTKYAINFLNIIPKFKNIVLVEGTPGSGKTSSVFKQVKTMLEKFNKDILNNVWVIHGADSNSAKIIKDDILELPEAKTFGRNSGMKEISSEWQDYSKDEKGDYIVPDNHYTLNSNNEIISSLKVNNSENPPSLIFIDEISKFTSYDLDLINKYAKLHGITVLVAGDFDQSGVKGHHSANKLGLNNIAWEISLDRTQFVRTPKLGMSMRTDNVVKTQNLTAFQLYMQNPEDWLKLKYTENEEGLFGDKVIPYTCTILRNESGEINSISDKNSILNNVIQEVKKLIDTLKKDDNGKIIKKIGYIYNDSNSPLYKELSKDAYKPYIDLKYGSSAQGLEGQYYIIEVDPSDDVSTNLRDIYTGISRASQGSLLITPSSEDEKGEDKAIPKITSEYRAGLVKENLPPDIIKKYSDKRKALLEKIVTDGNSIEVVKPEAQVEPEQQALEYSDFLRDQLLLNINNAESEEEILQYISDLDNMLHSNEASIDPLVIDAKNKRLEKLNQNDRGLSLGINNGTTNTNNSFTPELKSNLITSLNNAETEAEINILITEADLKSNGYASIDPDIINLKNKRIEEIRNQPQEESNVEPQEEPNTEPDIEQDTNSKPDIELSLEERYRKYSEDSDVKQLDDIDSDLLRKTNGKWFLPGDFVQFEDNDVYVVVSVNNDGSLNLHTLDDGTNEGGGFSMDVDEVIPYFEGNYNSDQIKIIDHERYGKYEEKQQQVEPVQIEDDAPITGMSVINEETYKNKLDESNESKDIPEIKIEKVEESSIPITMLLHSFNTFELGVLEDKNTHLPVQIGQGVNLRIDSINGLIKIDKLKGNSNLSTITEYKKRLGNLRSILFNTTNKSDLEEQLKNELGLSNIYCTFALKSSPRIDRNQLNKLDQDGYFGRVTPFSKSEKETTFGNGSIDLRSKEWHQKSIVAIIGTQESGNLLELPLLALSSPLTIIQTVDENRQPIFQDLLNDYNNLINTGESIRESLQKAANNNRNNPKYKDLIDLIDLWLFTDSGIFYIQDRTWTPSKDLENTGPHVILKKGYYQQVDGFEMNESLGTRPWINISDLANYGKDWNPQTRWTQYVYSSIDGTIEGVDGVPIKPGHSFVIVSFDKNINNDTRIIKRFKEELQNPDLPKKTKLMYVLPPKASIQEYLEHLFLGSRSNKSIGYVDTSFKLIKTLMNDARFTSIVERKYPLLYPELKNILDNIDINISLSDLKSILYTNYDWSTFGFGHKSIPLCLQLNDLLSRIISINNTTGTMLGLGREHNVHQIDPESMQIVVQILSENGIDRIYHHFKYERDPSTNDYVSNNGFIIPKQGNNYTLDGKPIQIHGKLDNYTYEGNISKLIRSWNKKVREGRGFQYSIDNTSYFDFKTKQIGNSELGPRRASQEELAKQRTISNIVNYVKSKIGEDVSYLFEDNTIEQALQKIVNSINIADDANIAFSIGTDLYIGTDAKLTGQIRIYNNQDELITDINQIFDNQGVSYFKVSINGETKNAKYDKNNKTLTLENQETQNSQQPQLFVDPENFTVYRNEALSFFEENYDWDEDVNNTFIESNYNNFIQKLYNIIPMNDNTRIDDLSALLEGASDIQTMIIKDLINIEKFNQERFNNQREQEGSSCPVVFTKIKF